MAGRRRGGGGEVGVVQVGVGELHVEAEEGDVAAAEEDEEQGSCDLHGVLVDE